MPEIIRRSRVLRQFFRNSVALMALIFLLVLVALSVVLPHVGLPDPNSQELANRLQRPSRVHWLGTDQFGRDLFSRMVSASGITLLAAIQALGIGVILGVPLGLIAGYVGRALDAILSRIADGLLALPPLILALAIVGILGPGLTNAMVAIGVVLSPRFFRVARGAAQSVSSEGYIEAALADGCSARRILFRHVLPNASGPLLVQMSFSVGLVITAEASLSFLGLGVQIPQSSWGSLIRDGFDVITQGRHLIIPPISITVATILALFLVGDGLRDAFRGAGRGRT